MTYLGNQIDELNRAIKDPGLAEVDDRNASSEYGMEDPYLGMELGIRRDDEGPHNARMKRRAVDEDGKPIGRPSNNPLLDNRKYEVEYINGTTEVFAANIIAESLLSQADDKGK